MKVEKHPVEKTITRFATSLRRSIGCEPRGAYMFQVYLSIQLTLTVFPSFLICSLTKRSYFQTEGLNQKPDKFGVFYKKILYECWIQKSLSQRACGWSWFCAQTCILYGSFYQLPRQIPYGISISWQLSALKISPVMPGLTLPGLIDESMESQVI